MKKTELKEIAQELDRLDRALFLLQQDLQVQSAAIGRLSRMVGRLLRAK